MPNVNDQTRMIFEEFLFNEGFKYSRHCDCGGSRSNVYEHRSPNVTVKHNIKNQRYRVLKNGRSLNGGDTWIKINPFEDAKRNIQEILTTERDRQRQRAAEAKIKNDQIAKRSSAIFRRQ